MNKSSNKYTSDKDNCYLHIKRLDKLFICILDLDSYAKAKQFAWKIMTNGYVRRSGNPKALHRYLIGAKDGQIVDHINRNPLDNRLCNLRIVTKSQNMINCVRKKNTSGCIGVYYNKKYDCYLASISIMHKNLHQRGFKKLEDAIKYRKQLEKEYGYDKILVYPR